MRAESLARRGDDGGALSAHERAIEHATAAPALHHMALAFERAGRFHERRGRRRLAMSHLVEACYHYERWGATAKAAQLREQFPDLARLAAAAADREAGRGASVMRTALLTRSAASGWLDLTSAMRATRAIASELRLQPLVERLMEILVENAGATSGCLVLQQGHALEVSASLTLEPHRVEVGLREPLEQSERLPAAIVQYCARSREVVVLDDAGTDRRFANDRRARALDGHSIACLPLLHQGHLVAVLYLENDAGAGVFHAGRATSRGHFAVPSSSSCFRRCHQWWSRDEGHVDLMQTRQAGVQGIQCDQGGSASLRQRNPGLCEVLRDRHIAPELMLAHCPSLRGTSRRRARSRPAAPLQRCER